MGVSSNLVIFGGSLRSHRFLGDCRAGMAYPHANPKPKSLNTKGPRRYMVYTWALKYMGTFLGPKCIPYTYVDPLGNTSIPLATQEKFVDVRFWLQEHCRCCGSLSSLPSVEEYGSPQKPLLGLHFMI